MTVYLAKGCGCRMDVGIGARRPERCVAHENRFYTEAQLRSVGVGVEGSTRLRTEGSVALGSLSGNTRGADPNAAAYEVWRSIWSELGTLEAIADALPESPVGAVLRGYQEHGLPEILPTAEQAVLEAGGGLDKKAAEKTYHRGYQVTALLIREHRGEKVPKSEYRRDPDEFFADAASRLSPPPTVTPAAAAIHAAVERGEIRPALPFTEPMDDPEFPDHDLKEER